VGQSRLFHGQDLNGTQLRRLVDGLCCRDDFERVAVTRSNPSELLHELRDTKLSNDIVSPAVQRPLADDDGALCCVALSSTLRCDVLLAVPDGSSADQVLGNACDGTL
jgi:hypothetical protein